MTPLRELVEAERAKAMSRARRLEPDAGTGEDAMIGPGAYDRGTAYGLGIAASILAESDGPRKNRS